MPSAAYPLIGLAAGHLASDGSGVCGPGVSACRDGAACCRRLL